SVLRLGHASTSYRRGREHGTIQRHPLPHTRNRAGQDSQPGSTSGRERSQSRPGPATTRVNSPYPAAPGWAPSPSATARNHAPPERRPSNVGTNGTAASAHTAAIATDRAAIRSLAVAGQKVDGAATRM